MKILFFFVIIISHNISAAVPEWIEGEGRVKISGAPLEEARRLAIENAIADASYSAGAVVTAEDSLINGVLSNSTLKVSTRSNIKNIEVLSESVENDILSVNIRVKIRDYNNCRENGYKTKVLVTNFQISEPRQASIGEIYSLGHHITNRISEQFNIRSGHAIALAANVALNRNSLSSSIDKTQVLSQSDSIARRFDTQYVIFGMVRDLSLFEIKEDSLFTSEEFIARNFTLSLLVVDVFRGLVIMEKSYHFESEWDFDLFRKINLNSSVFWQSDYGRSLIDLLIEIVGEVDTEISCRPVFSQIVFRMNGDYVINSGNKHNVETGSRFPLFRKAILPSDTVLLRKVEGSSFTVISADENTTVLSAKDNNIAISAQLYDLVQLE